MFWDFTDLDEEWIAANLKAPRVELHSLTATPAQWSKHAEKWCRYERRTNM